MRREILPATPLRLSRRYRNNRLLVMLLFGGFALCWFSKDLIIHAFVGTEVFVRNLEAKASALKAAVHAKAL